MSAPNPKKMKMAEEVEGAQEVRREDLAEWLCPASDISVDTINPIRNIVDNLKIPPNQGTKKMIPLSIGDPTVFGNLPHPQSAIDAITKQAMSGKNTGYCPSTGLVSAREAIAARYTKESAPLTAADVVIASGCSGALTLAIQSLCGSGDNILLPRPGFAIYETIACHTKIEPRFYNLDAARSWECDLTHMASLVDSRTRAILVNNPSNPTGSNYSVEHLKDILALAEKYKIPIISDEIYADMVFKGENFYAMASLTSTVPILSCGGLAKQFLVPGWRVGWITIHDRNGILAKEVIPGLIRLSQLILGACTLAQAAVPDIFANTPQSFFTDLNDLLETQARVLITELSKIECLNLITPQGAMYLMVEIDPEKFKDIKDETDFAQKLMDEELVFVLPGTCFKAPGFIRLVTCPPADMLTRAAARIATFCAKHAK